MLVDQHQFHGLLHSAELVEAILRRRLVPLGIHPRQARVLEAMSRTGAVSQTRLATTFEVSSASMSTMTERLLAAGYITRMTDPASRRQNLIELTDKGRVLLVEIEAAWGEVDKAIRVVLGEESSTFLELARRLRNGLGGMIPGSEVQ